MTWLASYRRGWLRGDVLAGVTVAAYLVPQVMAYAEVAGLPPVVGLWAILGPLVVYALLGSSRQLSVGPESTTALMTAAAVGPLAAGDPARYAALAALLALLVGGLCLVGWLARLGVLADLLSRPVIVGYMTGIALLMIISQLAKVTGVRVRGENPAAQLVSFLSGLSTVHWPTLALAGSLLAGMLVAGRVFPRVPVPLFGMLIAAGVVSVFSLADKGIRVVGQIPAGLPAPGLPDVSGADLTALILPALGVMLVGYSDNVLTARAFAGRHGQRVDANRELLALGGANLSSGLLRGFPVSSSGSRTVIGDAMGSRTQLYSLVALAAVLLTLLVGRPVLAAFPIAALGAIVIYAATRLIDIGELRRITAFRRSELVLALATTVAVLAVDVLYGILFAVGLSSWTCCAGWPGRTTGSSAMSRGGRHARHRRLPRRHPGTGPGGVSLRRAAVLRQRGELPCPGAGLGGRRTHRGGMVPAQRRGQRRDRQHRGGRAGRAARRADRPRDHVRHGPGQAGSARRPARRRHGREDRRRPDLPNLAHRGRRLPAGLHRAARRSTPWHAGITGAPARGVLVSVHG